MPDRLVQWLVCRMARRMGRKHAMEVQLPLADPDAIARSADRSFWRRVSTETNFEACYGVAWRALGAKDARDGITRATAYKNHCYNVGWRQEILDLNAKGWRNQRLAPKMAIMESLYWQKRMSGTSSEFYEFFDFAPQERHEQHVD